MSIEDAAFDLHVAASLADLDAIRARWLILINRDIAPHAVVQHLHFYRDIHITIPHTLSFRQHQSAELNGEDIDVLLRAWQYETFSAGVLARKYMPEADFRRYSSRMAALGGPRWSQAVTLCYRHGSDHLQNGMITALLGLYLTAGGSDWRAAEEFLADSGLNFLSNLTHMKTAFAFADMLVATTFADRIDPERRW